MYRLPKKDYAKHANSGIDCEQIIQAYEQGYELRRMGQNYNNPWKMTPMECDTATGYPKQQMITWESELNMWFHNGYYDWNPTDWIPWLPDDQQSEFAVNPKTGKSRTSIHKMTPVDWKNPQPVINLANTVVI